MDERKRHAKGMKVRRAVLGDAHVDRAAAAKTTFTEPFQNLIARYAWGEIWSRPEIPRKTRSLLTIAMMVALNRPDELRMHLRAAANCGVTRKEIQKFCCKRRSIAAFPRRTEPFTSQKKSSRKRRDRRTGRPKPGPRGQPAIGRQAASGCAAICKGLDRAQTHSKCAPVRVCVCRRHATFTTRTVFLESLAGDRSEPVARPPALPGLGGFLPLSVGGR